MRAQIAQAVGSAVELISRRNPLLHPPISRAAFRRLIPRPALEIGPFDVPFLTGSGVEYFDILDQEAMRKRARELGRNPNGCPHVHYTGRLGDVPKRFAAVFSSHTIEHIPDLIGHLEDVAALLKPGGAYYLIIPDKRYCFDHFRPISTIGDVEAMRGGLRPSVRAIRERWETTTHNNPLRHWLGLHGRPAGNRDGANREIEEAVAGKYIDVHQWAFMPESFRHLMLHVGVFTGVKVFDTRALDLEFMAELTR